MQYQIVTGFECFFSQLVLLDFELINIPKLVPHRGLHQREVRNEEWDVMKSRFGVILVEFLSDHRIYLKLSELDDPYLGLRSFY